MNKVLAYLKDSKSELVNKVTWPAWSELQNSTIVVVIACIIISAVVFVIDKVFGDILIGSFYAMFE